MFEGKPPIAPDSRDENQGDTPEEIMSEMQWSDLVSRLSAARELRAELAETDEATLASFDAESARHLARHNGSAQSGNYERDVNPVDLVNGKGRAAETQERADRDTTASRGNT